MTLEALNLQLDNFKCEIQALKVENAKLQEGNPSFRTVEMVEQGEMDEYAQDLSRLYQKAYPQALQGTGETETMGKTVLAYQFVAGLLPNIRAKIAGTEGTFEQLWVKARYEEAKTRDLEPKSTMGYSTNRRPPVVKEDGWMQPQNQPNQNAATRKCWLWLC